MLAGRNVHKRLEDLFAVVALKADFIVCAIRVLSEQPMNGFLTAVRAEIMRQHFFCHNQTFNKILNKINNAAIAFVLVMVFVRHFVI